MIFSLQSDIAVAIYYKIDLSTLKCLFSYKYLEQYFSPMKIMKIFFTGENFVCTFFHSCFFLASFLPCLSCLFFWKNIIFLKTLITHIKNCQLIFIIQYPRLESPDSQKNQITIKRVLDLTHYFIPKKYTLQKLISYDFKHVLYVTI